MKKTKTMTPVYVRLDREDFAKLESRAIQTNKTVAGLCREIISGEFEGREKVESQLLKIAKSLEAIQAETKKQGRGIFEAIKYSLRAGFIAENLAGRLINQNEIEALMVRVESQMREAIG